MLGKPCAAGEAASPLEDSDQGMIRNNQETCRCSEEFGCFVRSAYFFKCLACSRIVLQSPGVPCSSCCLHLERWAGNQGVCRTCGGMITMGRGLPLGLVWHLCCKTQLLQRGTEPVMPERSDGDICRVTVLLVSTWKPSLEGETGPEIMHRFKARSSGAHPRSPLCKHRVLNPSQNVYCS